MDRVEPRQAAVALDRKKQVPSKTSEGGEFPTQTALAVVGVAVQAARPLLPANWCGFPAPKRCASGRGLDRLAHAEHCRGNRCRADRTIVRNDRGILLARTFGVALDGAGHILFPGFMFLHLIGRPVPVRLRLNRDVRAGYTSNWAISCIYMFNKLLSNAGLRPKLHVPLTFTSALRLDGNRLDRNTGGV